MTLENEMFTIVGGDANTMHVRLHADHDIYRAHFPDTPITPGVCIVQMIGELLSQQVGHRLSLSRIVNLKFVSTISPVENPLIEVNLSSVEHKDDGFRAKGSITSNKELKTKFSIIFV